ncbi:MAG: DUF3368 domain-containing protein [Bacteroidetes bacterium]|nr:DUF3368 domain-containing protein [Bacteroidota bacterium]MBL7103814.1 DUF3368 domain-containing protein [Bacteroidales bacterium]
MNKYISDTSCIILFDKIGELDLLQRTYGVITTTPEVIEEYGKPVPDWIEIKTVINKNKQKEFEKIVDWGEASAIALALELKKSILIIDDKRGRKLANKLNIKMTGTLGTLLKAKQRGVIQSVRQLLEKLKQIDYWISEDIANGILKKAKE